MRALYSAVIAVLMITITAHAEDVASNQIAARVELHPISRADATRPQREMENVWSSCCLVAYRGECHSHAYGAGAGNRRT
jgi:hypothetical protein